MLSLMVHPEEATQREDIFHTCCIVKGKVYNLVIDGVSCINVASSYLVDKLAIEKTKHHRPYKL